MDFENAKKRLVELGQAGRLIRVGDDEWEVDALPERTVELQRQQRQREAVKSLEKAEAEQKELERLLSLERGKKILEERSRREAEESKRERDFFAAERERRSSHDSWICIDDAFPVPVMDADWSPEVAVKSLLRDRYGADAEILMQYRHAGSNSEQGNEWGLWIVRRGREYAAYHESEDRERYGGRSREKVFRSRVDAINYSAWHVDRDWYSDERFIAPEVQNHDFPRKSPPSFDEREEARKRFKRWKDIASE